jgi:hypothetical protein
MMSGAVRKTVTAMFTTKVGNQQGQSRLMGIWHRCATPLGIVGELF